MLDLVGKKYGVAEVELVFDITGRIGSDTTREHVQEVLLGDVQDAAFILSGERQPEHQSLGPMMVSDGAVYVWEHAGVCVHPVEPKRYVGRRSRDVDCAELVEHRE